MLLPFSIALIALALGACASKPPPREYVFGWPDFPHADVTPRGGTSLGAPVTLRTEPTKAWLALQAKDLSPEERDQAAIRALAGDYRVSFDFLETVIFDDNLEPDQPYRSWGTEKVYVLEDRPGFISLQHVMVMFMIDDDDNVVGPFVQKHWRQDWQYEPERMHVYEGFDQWTWRAVPEANRRGAWSQTVYQVDDAPRYTLLGRWTHAPDFSTWQSEDDWRPLPRRESTVRDDYQVLAGPNRITVLPTGWIHEQDNLKRVIEAPGDDAGPVIARAREIGLARYEELDDFDFEAGDAYWERTGDAWAEVRAGWQARIDASPTHTIAANCQETPVFVSLFLLTDPEMRAAHEAAMAEAAAAEGDEAATEPSEPPDFDDALAEVLDCVVKPVAGSAGDQPSVPTSTRPSRY